MNRGWKGVGIITLVILIGLFLIPKESEAIPAFARKYGVSCAVCHRPDPPRLNTLGHRFRKYGYRMPEELGKDPNYKEIGEYIAMRGRGRYEYEKFAKGKSATTSRFKWNDATFFYAGSMTKNLSAFFEWEWEDESEIGLNGQFSWFMGDADRYLQLRLGQMHTLTRVGWAGFDRPTGISTTNVLSTDIDSSAVPFKINQDQRGLEASIGVTKDARIIAQLLNGLNFAGDGNHGSQDDDTNKDFLLAYEQNLTERGTGFTLFGYRGVWHSGAGADDVTQYVFYRTGATGSLVFPTPFYADLESEIQGGVMYAHDVPPSAASVPDNVDGIAYWLGAEEWFKNNASVFGRLDFVNPDIGPDKWANKYVLGGTYHLSDYLRLALEGFYNAKENGTDSAGVTTEAMFNF